MRVVAIIPRRSDGGRRDELWAFCRARLEADHPDIEIWEGHHNDGPFNAARAFNSAAEAAGKWDVAVYLGADMLIDVAQVRAAVGHAAEHGFSVAYSEYRYLGRAISDLILDGYTGDWSQGVEFTLTNSIGGCGAISWDLWRTIGGYDERFAGWGGEDVAFFHAASTFADDTLIVDGPIWHLWHPGQPSNNEHLPGYRQNMALMGRYGLATGDRDAMRALIEEVA